MGIFFLPDLSNTTAPIPLEPKLPQLCETICPNCHGVGYLEHPDDPMLSERCDVCFGRSTLEVCEGCGERPHSGTDECGCVSLCEACGERPQSTDALCSVCLIEGFRKVLADDREGLERYLELKSRELTPSEKALEIQAAKGYGWL